MEKPARNFTQKPKIAEFPHIFLFSKLIVVSARRNQSLVVTSAIILSIDGIAKLVDVNAPTDVLIQRIMFKTVSIVVMLKNVTIF